MTDFNHWTLTVDDRIGTLTLNRAEFMNTLTPAALYELRDITAEIRDNSAIWAVILEGAGDHFSVGVDVNAIQNMVGQNRDDFKTQLEDLQSCLDQFEALEKPTIAKIKGHCIGGGLLLALCCDFRVVDTSALFQLPEVKLGIAVIMGTQRITQIAGLAATKEMIMLAGRFTPQKALDYGLITELVEPDELELAVEDLAGKFRTLPPRTVGIAKRIIDDGFNMSLRESQDLEIELQSTLLDSPDFAEGVQAFFDKRKAEFIGE